MIYWSSLSDFMAMGGYGGFVWSAFGLTALTIVLEIGQLRWQRKQLEEAERGQR
jgi:heme exporter protein D